jgi:DUSAM domain-containing protein
MSDEDRPDWIRLRELERQVFEQGKWLDLNGEPRVLLSRSARQVAVGPAETEEALRSVVTAKALLREILQRIMDAELREAAAGVQASRLQGQGDFTGARKVLEDLLAVEAVPHYRKQVELRLSELATLEAVFLTGHVRADVFDPWAQVCVLALRVQQGHRLELRDDLRAFLRQTAPSAAFSEVEAEQALETLEGAEAFVAQIVERQEQARKRFESTMNSVDFCEDEGDLEGALQALRDFLEVEVIPEYRRMAEERLARYDKPPPR